MSTDKLQPQINPQRIIGMASAFYESCILFAASDAGVFRLLAMKGQADALTLSRELNMNTRGLGLLLDACVALRLLAKDGDVYTNTEESAALLVPGLPGDLSGAIRYNRDVYRAWGNLTSLVRSGEPVEAPALHLGEDLERTRTFVLSMHYRALGIGRAVIPRLDLADRQQLLDIGGGPGTYASLMAQEYPRLSCTVIDLPGVVTIAGELIRNAGLANRVRTIGGDYHTTAFPDGNDVVTFFGVLHQEAPAAIRTLLRKAFDSLTPGGIIYVLDMMTDSTHTHPVFSALFAVNMALTTNNGWVFADSELRAWMLEAGFENCSIEPAGSTMPHWLARATKPRPG